MTAFSTKILTNTKQTKGRRLVIPDIHGCSFTFRSFTSKN